MEKQFDALMLVVSLIALIVAYLRASDVGWLLIPCIAYFGFMSYGHYKGWER